MSNKNGVHHVVERHGSHGDDAWHSVLEEQATDRGCAEFGYLFLIHLLL
jgi:hypothetical protein